MDALLSKASSKADSSASKSLGKKLVEGLGALAGGALYTLRFDSAARSAPACSFRELA